ncbi:MAG TPA: hypothetical protein VJ966_19825, partial [Actinomycetes bacterium]|nr:hypothetical protein [Actinomycetes bacterium]
MPDPDDQPPDPPGDHPGGPPDPPLPPGRDPGGRVAYLPPRAAKARKLILRSQLGQPHPVRLGDDAAAEHQHVVGPALAEQ